MEHRAANRHRVLKAATIEFGGGGISCTVRNMSDSGAMLDVTSPVGIPAMFRWLSRPRASISPARLFGGRKNGSA
jgi:hypothetical protein